MSVSSIVNVDDMADEIMKGLQEYVNLVDVDMKKAVKKTAISVKAEIKSNAPKKTGEYAKG